MSSNPLGITVGSQTFQKQITEKATPYQISMIVISSVLFLVPLILSVLFYAEGMNLKNDIMIPKLIYLFNFVGNLLVLIYNATTPRIHPMQLYIIVISGLFCAFFLTLEILVNVKYPSWEW